MSHFYVSFKITLGTDYRLRRQMLCRRQEEEPDNGPISKMSIYFFFFPLFCCMWIPLYWAIVLWWWIQWWVFGALITGMSHGEWWSSVSHRDECGVTPKLSEILVRKLESGMLGCSPSPCKCCRHTSQHCTVTSRLTSLLSGSFDFFFSFIYLNFAQVDAICVSEKEWNWNSVVLQGLLALSAY